MRVKISSIKINPGRREVTPQSVEKLARTIAAVGLLNPIALDQNNALAAGLRRRRNCWTGRRSNATSSE